MKIVGFDILRVLFMLMVFMSHIVPPYMGGDVAVAGCFIMGGFLLALRYGDRVLEGDFSWRQFAIKRAIRFYPTHWLVLIFFLLTLAVPHLRIQWIGKVLTNVCLIQTWVPKSSWYFAFNSPSWYLCDVLFFTIIFPSLYKCISQLNIRKKIVLLIALLMGYLGLFLVVPVSWRNPIMYVNPIVRLMDGILGVYLAYLFKKLSHSDIVIEYVNRRVILLDCSVVSLLIIVCLQSLFTMIPNVPLEYWIPLLLLVLFVALRSLSPQKTWLVQLAENSIVQCISAISFAFYLWHAPVIQIIERSLLIFDITSTCMIGLCAFVATLILAYITHYFFESNMIKYLQKKIIKN